VFQIKDSLSCILIEHRHSYSGVTLCAGYIFVRVILWQKSLNCFLETSCCDAVPIDNKAATFSLLRAPIQLLHCSYYFYCTAKRCCFLSNTPTLSVQMQNKTCPFTETQTYSSARCS